MLMISTIYNVIEILLGKVRGVASPHPCVKLCLHRYSIYPIVDCCAGVWSLSYFCLYLQILPYINGFNHVKKIAAESEVDIDIVRVCIQHLV